MNNGQLLKIVEQYSRKSGAGFGDITITRVPDQKTVFVEQFDGVGPAVMIDKYKVDDAKYWAGYSSRREIVNFILAA